MTPSLIVGAMAFLVWPQVIWPQMGFCTSPYCSRATPGIKIVKYGTRILIQGCCTDSLSVENESQSDGMRVVELTEEDTSRYDIRVCSICPRMNATWSRRLQKARKL